MITIRDFYSNACSTNYSNFAFSNFERHTIGQRKRGI